MFGDGSEKALAEAVREELQHGVNKHGWFKSHHEAWAVTKEEAEEVVECFMPLNATVGQNLDILWDFIRHDNMGEDDAQQLVERIHEVMEELAKECIQVMAMCKKWMKLIDKETRSVSEENLPRRDEI